MRVYIYAYIKFIVHARYVHVAYACITYLSRVLYTRIASNMHIYYVRYACLLRALNTCITYIMHVRRVYYTCTRIHHALGICMCA